MKKTKKALETQWDSSSPRPASSSRNRLAAGAVKTKKTMKKQRNAMKNKEHNLKKNMNFKLPAASRFLEEPAGRRGFENKERMKKQRNNMNKTEIHRTAVDFKLPVASRFLEEPAGRGGFENKEEQLTNKETQ